ncbi:MAG: hypothetical protein Q7N50_10645, partial [Armatimonadota bacterium]|nr:hypothetical protein [Armatimonadota bacterium]
PCMRSRDIEGLTMQDFWRLMSILVCLSGFAVTGGLLLYRGESLTLAIIKAIGAFVGLYVVFKTLGDILMSATGFEPRSSKKKESTEETPAPAEQK